MGQVGFSGIEFHDIQAVQQYTVQVCTWGEYQKSTHLSEILDFAN